LTAPEPAAPGEDRTEGERLAPVGLIVTTLSRLPDLFVPIVAALYGTRGTDLGALPVIATVLVLSLGYRWLAWRRFRYFVGEDDIRIEHGLISRAARSVPYDRIADVSIEQPALARMLGLAMVRFETGGGKGEEVELRYVTEADAARLRETVRARKAGVKVPGDGAGAEPAEEAPAELLFAMDLPRLLTLGLYSFNLVIFVVLLGVAQQLDFLLPFDWNDMTAWIGAAEKNGLAVTRLERSTQVLGVVAALAALVAVGLASGIVRTVLSDWGFRLERTAKGLRRQRGLLTLTDVTIPVGRVQAVVLGSGAVRAQRGWHDLRLVSLATESAKESHHMVVPLARLEEIWPIVTEVNLAPPAPDLAFARPHYGPWLDQSLIAAVPFLGGASLAAANGFPTPWLLALPALALVAGGRLSWRRTSRAVDADQLYARQGWWNRAFTIARQVNVQSVTLSRGPLERLRGLATVHFGIPGGELHFRAVPLAEARAIRSAVLAIVTPVDFSRLARQA
jgi:putative membrane protein